MPTAVGVYVTWQVAVPAVVPAERLQLVAGVKLPVPSLAKPTLPVGVVAPVAEVSVTVAVQTVPVLTVTDAGTQLTLVEVGCAVGAVTVNAKLPWLAA